MYRIVKDINKTLRKEEISKLERFRKKNPGKDVYVYYVTTRTGCGFSYIVTTDYISNNEEFENYYDITDYDGRKLETF